MFAMKPNLNRPYWMEYICQTRNISIFNKHDNNFSFYLSIAQLYQWFNRNCINKIIKYARQKFKEIKTTMNHVWWCVIVFQCDPFLYIVAYLLWTSSGLLCTYTAHHWNWTFIFLKPELCREKRMSNYTVQCSHPWTCRN